MEYNKLRIAIFKTSDLFDSLFNALKECDLTFNRENKYKIVCKNFPLEFVFVQPKDIPVFVEEGLADVGILTEDIYEESLKRLSVKMFLPFNKYDLCISSLRSEIYEEITDLIDKKIATNYPNILNNFLIDTKLQAHVITVTPGAMKLIPDSGMADAICDIIDTNSDSNNSDLKNIVKIKTYSELIIHKKNLLSWKMSILDDLCFRLKAVIKSNGNKYIVLNAPIDSLEYISTLMPGLQSPTYIKLYDPGWLSIQAVISEDNFWEIIEQLKDAGGKDILVLPIEKMI